MIFNHQYYILDYLLFLHHIVPSFGEGNSNPLQNACLENPIDREAQEAIVHELAKESQHI